MLRKIAGLTACLGTLLIGGATSAAEINVIASTAMREVLEELIPLFERASGHKVTVSFQSGAVLPAKIKEGAQADLVVTTPETIDDLVKAAKVLANSRVDFVRSGAGVAVRAGAPKPEIGTPDAFRTALLAAKSVGYSQGPSGVHFLAVLARLGIADQVKAKGVVSASARWSPGARPRSAFSRSPNCCRSPASSSSGRCRRSCRQTSSIRPQRRRLRNNATPLPPS
jgi:ABC-type molybdate transport system substrate-binding protein